MSLIKIDDGIVKNYFSRKTVPEKDVGKYIEHTFKILTNMYGMRDDMQKCHFPWCENAEEDSIPVLKIQRTKKSALKSYTDINCYLRVMHVIENERAGMFL